MVTLVGTCMIRRSEQLLVSDTTHTQGEVGKGRRRVLEKQESACGADSGPLARFDRQAVRETGPTAAWWVDMDART